VEVRWFCKEIGLHGSVRTPLACSHLALAQSLKLAKFHLLIHTGLQPGDWGPVTDQATVSTVSQSWRWRNCLVLKA